MNRIDHIISPEALAAYEQLSPGAAEKIFRMVEQEFEHQRQRDLKRAEVLEENARRLAKDAKRLRQWQCCKQTFSGIGAVSGVGLAVWGILIAHNPWTVAFLVLPLMFILTYQ